MTRPAPVPTHPAPSDRPDRPTPSDQAASSRRPTQNPAPATDAAPDPAADPAAGRATASPASARAGGVWSERSVQVERQVDGQFRRPGQPQSRGARVGVAVLLGLVGVGLGVVILTPIALSSQDLIAWAGAPTGLDLPDPWPLLVFAALDAAAAVCVLLTVYCAWRGEPAGVFGVLVWAFALTSAFANWRHSNTSTAAPDAVWFFPTMSLAGPALLEAVLGRFRRWTQRDRGRRARTAPAFGWRRWIPGLGALRDTYGSYRTALLLDLDTVQDAVTAYHRLCPDGSLRIAAALRARHTRPDAILLTGHPAADEVSDVGLAGCRDLPVDLMRRIPVQQQAYQRWRSIWNDLQMSAHASHHPNGQSDDQIGDQPIGPTGATSGGSLKDVADRHELSVRQVEFIRRAGESGLLDSEIPPAVRLAALTRTHPRSAGTDRHPPAERDTSR